VHALNDDVKQLDSLEDALGFLAQYERDSADCPDVNFGGELAIFRTYIEGKNYNGTVPAELARGLVELQDELYRAAAFSLYGVDSIKKLSPEERQHFELIFKVNEGSSELIAQLKTFMEKLGDGFSNMTSGHKTITLVLIVAVIASSWGATVLYEKKTDVEKEEVKSHTTLAMEQEKTAQFKLMADLVKASPAAERFAKATEEGTRAIVKGASDAQSIKIGRTKFDRDAISEINQRAAKDKAEPRILTQEFQIIRVDFRDASTLKLWLASKETGEFSVIVIDDDESDPDGIRKVWSSAKDRKPIKLEVSATYVRNQIKAAQVVRVL
jgi:hypothetical protein